MLRPEGDPLMQGLAEGREEAFAALYDCFGPALFRVAGAMLGSRADAEDAVQEVFVGLVRARQTLGKVENLRAYLFASLRHAVAKLAAQRRSQEQVPWRELSQLAASAPRAADLEQAVRLERTLRALPAEQRELVVLKVDGGTPWDPGMQEGDIVFRLR